MQNKTRAMFASNQNIALADLKGLFLQPELSRNFA